MLPISGYDILLIKEWQNSIVKIKEWQNIKIDSPLFSLYKEIKERNINKEKKESRLQCTSALVLRPLGFVGGCLRGGMV